MFKQLYTSLRIEKEIPTKSFIYEIKTGKTAENPSKN